MAIAEKAVTEKSPRTPEQALPVTSLLGALYLLISLGVVFTGLPAVWSNVLHIDEYLNEFLSSALLLMVTALAAVGFIYLGILLEKNPPQGFRAGSAVLAVALLVIFLITMNVGARLASSSLDSGVGFGVMAATAGLLLAAVWYLFQRPGFCRWLIKIEDQGWFHARTYKGNQGLRVRRGTIIGILIIGFSGIITMVSSNLLRTSYGSDKWVLDVPYSEPVLGATAKVVDEKLVVAKVKSDSPAARSGLQPDDEIVQIAKKDVKVDPAYLSQVIATKFPGERVEFKVNRDKKTETVAVDLGAATMPIVYNVQVIIPLLLSALLVWFAWRVVHLPVFADFLIATEAEMNKVSWTTRKRLAQDTVVVLVTVVLMAVFLFVVDIVWIKVLGAVQVLRVDIRSEQLKQQEKSQW